MELGEFCWGSGGKVCLYVLVTCVQVVIQDQLTLTHIPLPTNEHVVAINQLVDYSDDITHTVPDKFFTEKSICRCLHLIMNILEPGCHQ